jgi:acyl carrier protein
MNIDRDKLISGIKQLIESDKRIGRGKIESPDQELDIDSLLVTMIIAFADSEYGVEIGMDRLDYDAFRTLNKIVDMLTNCGVCGESKEKP